MTSLKEDTDFFGMVMIVVILKNVGTMLLLRKC